MRRSGGKVSSIQGTAEEMEKKKKLCINNYFISVMKNPLVFLLFGNLGFHGNKFWSL